MKRGRRPHEKRQKGHKRVDEDLYRMSECMYWGVDIYSYVK